MEQVREGRTGQKTGRSFRGVLAACLLLGFLAGGAPMARAAGETVMTGGAAGRRVIPVGRAVGIKIFSDGVLVVGFSQIPASGGNVTPAKSCGLREGDVITHINSTEVDTVEEVQEELKRIGGEEMSIRALRDGKTVQVTAQAVKCSTDGTYKLGAWLRDSMAGIGTVTYYDPSTGAFGALGHGVNDVDTAQLMPLESGGLLPATVADVKKGKRGEPGELHGAFDADKDMGTLIANTTSGIFGFASGEELALREPVEVASKDQVKEGPAVISKLYPAAQDGRDMMIKVTDPALLEATGGIVQGMSGSPILQDGRLIGAVTHVLVSDPTQGYAILAERMLETAEESGKTGE